MVMISSFFLINKVSAAEPITTVGTSIYNLEDCTYFTYTEEQIENLIQSAKLKLTELGYNAEEFNKFTLTVHRASYGVVAMFYFFNDLDIENNNYRFTLSNDAYAPITVGYSTSNGRIRFYKSKATNAGQLSYDAISKPVTNTNTGFKYFEANDSSGVYILTNFDLKNSSGEVIIPQNYKVEPTSYEFNEDIDVTDISKIKINFELPEDTRNLEVDIKWTFDNYTSGGNGFITTPYLEFKHSNGDISLSQDITNLNGGDWFSDNYIATLLPDSDITEISLIVDTVKASGLLKANFSSKFPYSISYEYIEEVEDYFVTINMDDYASISLIPKVYNIESSISSSISSPIYKYGIYDVEIWEDLETKKVIDRWDNHSTSQFIYPMYSGYKNCIIHFIKKEVDASERYIKFDSRYYSYVVKKYLNEEVTIINPNTNENITIPDTSDLYKYDSPVDKRFSFNSFLKPIKFVFESITDFYNNYCPEVVQYFFYLIFAFFVILVLVKIFL